ncbi:MAG TPA: hypothetical protein VL172_10200 [Kofleriaceae bacterium]|nr:hypothetical protein [Kofleriaceae bacterium]
MRPTLACLLLVACGGGGGGGNPDARPTADAGPADAAVSAYCYAQTTTDCGYSPEEVTPSDYSLADQAALAARFNPAMVYTGDDVWGVSVRYQLETALPDPGPPVLMRIDFTTKLNFSYDVMLGTEQAVFGDPQPDLTMLDFRTLPQDDGASTLYAYYLDGRGTNTGNDLAEETWTDAWRGIQGYADPDTVDPLATTYPPHQYAHFFWRDKATHLLAIQYWFYYPYDKFSNAHEGDWEHVNVVLDVTDAGAPVPAFYHFSWHGKQTGVLATDAYRVADDGDGDHLVAFIGGDVCTMFNELWCGDTAGSSWPYPGLWVYGQDETVAGYAARPGRAIHASDFTIDLLSRPQDMDFDARPDLSWYQLQVLFGEPITAVNDPVIMATNNNHAPVGPGPDHEEFEIGIEQLRFQLFDDSTPMPFVIPSGWTMINQPPASVFP